MKYIEENVEFGIRSPRFDDPACCLIFCNVQVMYQFSVSSYRHWEQYAFWLLQKDIIGLLN